MGGYLQNLFQSLDMVSLLDAAFRALAVLLCLSVHETCHGLAALALGDPTAQSRHRLSLNPLHHIDWLGLAMMFTVGFGWAKPVPVDSRYFRNPKWGMALTALAGPASNFLLAALAMVLGRLILTLAPGAAAAPVLFEFLVLNVAILSLGLGVFNLLPIPPLDGSKIAAAFLPDHLYYTWMRYEHLGMAALLLIVVFDLDGNFVSNAVRWSYLHLYELVFAPYLG